MERRRDQPTPAVSKSSLVEHIKTCLRSGDYSRVLDLLRGREAEFPNDAELSQLEKLAHDGIKRIAEANRLITESQELFAQQKSAEAIQLLREAYELDRTNTLARAILANSLVEHAHSMVEANWLEAEKLTNQALDLNPAHPTAKTIRSLIVDQKEASSVDDWVAQARKLQSSGDLFAALAWVAEGLAVHPDEPKLLQIQDAIQRDQGARRRQARRGDLDNLRRMELEIDEAADVAAKQALAERIQAMAAKYWTDGEILSVANRLLHRLGLVPQESSTALSHSKGATVIFHVPRPGAPGGSHDAACQISPSQATPSEVPPSFVPPVKVPTTPPGPQPPAGQAATIPGAEPSPPVKVTPPTSGPKQRTKPNSTTPILVSAAAIVLGAAIFFFFFSRRHHAPAVATTAPGTATVSAPAVAAAVQTAPETSLPDAGVSPDTAHSKVPLDNRTPADSGHNLGALLVVAGQDDARVFLNGKLQPQLTQAGQLRLQDLELKDYVVNVSKPGFQDAPQQKIRIRKGEDATLIFNLQPQSRSASLTIQGGAPGTMVLVDQTLIGTIPPDGTLSLSTVTPGDHILELRKERFKPKQFKEHFVAGGTISLTAADAVLEAASGELKITFAPTDAKVAIVQGDLLKMVSSGVPLSVPPGIYTLTARTAERFTRSSTIEVVGGQSKSLDLSLAPSGMSKWEDPGAWKREGDSFIRKGGEFVLYGVTSASGTFVFSAMLTKGRLLQWVANYIDSKNYVLLQMDDKNFYRSVIRNGSKSDEIIVPHRGEKKSFRTIQIRVSPTEIVHQTKHGDNSIVLDRWTQPGVNLSQGKFGFYIPGNDEVALSSFAHYADLNIR